jgi:SWI/SNF-related matrix-associated actin-dependent regulator of chromatin subfamily A member 5
LCHAVYVPLSPVQRFWYQRLLTRVDSLTLDQIFTAKAENDDDVMRELKENVQMSMKEEKEGKGGHWTKMMGLLMQLRRVCDQCVPISMSVPFELC